MISIRDFNKTSDEEKFQIIELIKECLGEDRAAQAQQLMDKDCVEYVVGVDEDIIIGCAAYAFSGFHYSTWWLGFAAVKPNYRRLGISDQMIDYRIEKIRSIGAKWIIASSLEPVERFLKKGFVKILDMNPHKLVVLEID